jgi:flagellar hook protein FlgE
MAFVGRLQRAGSWGLGFSAVTAWGAVSGCGVDVTHERLNDDSSERQGSSPLRTDTPRGDGDAGRDARRSGSGAARSDSGTYTDRADGTTEPNRIDAGGSTGPQTAVARDPGGLSDPVDEVLTHDGDAGFAVLASSGPGSEASTAKSSSTGDLLPADGGATDADFVASGLEICEPAVLVGASYAEVGQFWLGEQQSQPKQVTGEGYFIAAYADDTSLHYSRRTRISVAPDGTIQDEKGEILLGFANITSGETKCVSPLRAPIAFAPVPTSLVKIRANLDAGAAISSFDLSSPADSHAKTTVPVVDSLGEVRQLDVYFIKSADGVFEYHVLVDGLELAGGVSGQTIEIGSGTLTFDAYGRLADAQTPDFSVDFDQATPGQVIAIDFGLDILNDAGDGTHATSSKYDASAVTFQSHDGWTAGAALQMTVNVLGEVTIEYDNGRKQVIGTLALARFADEAALVSNGTEGWLESAGSGAPAVALPLAAGRGIVESTTQLTAGMVVENEQEDFAFIPRPWMLCEADQDDGFIYWAGETFPGDRQSIAVDGLGYLVSTWPEAPLFRYSTNTVLSVAPGGLLVDAAGHAVLGFAGADGNSSCLSAFRFPTHSKFMPTTRVVITGNLDADATVGEDTPEFELEFSVVEYNGRLSTIHLAFTKVASGYWSYRATSDGGTRLGADEWVDAGEGGSSSTSTAHCSMLRPLSCGLVT